MTGLLWLIISSTQLTHSRPQNRKSARDGGMYIVTRQRIFRILVINADIALLMDYMVENIHKRNGIFALTAERGWGKPMDEPILIKAKAIEQRASDGCVTVEVDTVTGKLQMFVYPEQLTAERTGKWITHKSTDFGEKLNHCIECSECGIWFSACELLRRSYCPNCGARMEGNNE